MNFLPPFPHPLSPTVALLLCPLILTLHAEPSLRDLTPSSTRLLLAQAGPGAGAAVSSQAVATQPNVPKRADEANPAQTTVPAPNPAPPPPPEGLQILDPRLDPDRPKDSQLSITKEQTLPCGTSVVVLPAATYEQKRIVENPEGRRAIGTTTLKPQQVGLGYIRYLSDVPLKINGVERPGGLDVPIRKEDNLPVRIWYKKMTEPDDVTKAFTFILPPVALIAGAGAWASGNILLPDTPPEFTEARDYYLKPLQGPPKPAHSLATPEPQSLAPTPSRHKTSGLRTP